MTVFDTLTFPSLAHKNSTRGSGEATRRECIQRHDKSKGKSAHAYLVGSEDASLGLDYVDWEPGYGIDGLATLGNLFGTGGIYWEFYLAGQAMSCFF